ncbi:hypothetical protein A6F65_01892 [Paraurantiacibacter namhicola]|uniref:DUF1761 domain-containing protein n=2 Tax=Paraurantiacibacter namhicola TaxID=645517 RepID=A0A1C7D9L7_9SPHN|nr:hypothetical protein A6F65_01892 [Paraurantiacibacter namhicola]
MEVNWFAVIAAGVSAFMLGGIWYGPLFGKMWQAENGLSDEQLAEGNMAKIFGLALVLSLVAAFVFGMFLGPDVDVQFGAMAGFSAGLFWVGAALGIVYLFERRSLKHWAINAGYVTLQFTLYGVIFGLLS